MEKLCIPKAFLKMAGGRMHSSHPTPLYPPLAISYRNYQKSLAYFSHLAPLILFILLKGRVKRGVCGGGGGGAWPNRTQTHFRRHKHTARENQRYRSSAVKLASSSRTPKSFFSHPQLGTAALRCFFISSTIFQSQLQPTLCILRSEWIKQVYMHRR